MNKMTQLTGQIEALDAKKTQLQQIIHDQGRHDALLSTLRAERLRTLAEALAAGAPSPSTAKLDKEITALELARTQAIEQAEVAAAAIGIVEASKQAIQGEINQLRSKVRDDAITAIDAECRESIEQAESILAKLLARLAALPKHDAPAPAVFQMMPAGAAKIDTRVYRLDAELLSQLKAKLMHAGAIGTAQYNVFTSRRNLDAFSRLLANLAQQLVFARRERDIEAPEWTMGVLPVDATPILERLRSAGVQVA